MRIHSKTIKQTIQKQTEPIRNLHQQVHQTFVERNNSKADWQAWERGCAVFHQSYDTALGFDGGECGLLAQLDQHHAHAMEYAVCFIEIRPYFFRSGYLYQKLQENSITCH